MHAKVRLEDLEKQFGVALRDIQAAVDEDLEGVAQTVYNAAKETTAFRDKTKTLRRRIKLLKSLFPDGGWIVRSGAPHSHLVEYGHDLYVRGRYVGRVEPHPFLRPAYEKGVSEAIAKFKG